MCDVKGRQGNALKFDNLGTREVAGTFKNPMKLKIFTDKKISKNFSQNFFFMN